MCLIRNLFLLTVQFILLYCGRENVKLIGVYISAVEVSPSEQNLVGGVQCSGKLSATASNTNQMMSRLVKETEPRTVCLSFLVSASNKDPFAKTLSFFLLTIHPGGRNPPRGDKDVSNIGLPPSFI